ncbi:uncharacterized protein LOC62_03G005200 [Vanrija pseudolonga]|uniref:Uncharacterized protein n=1 Tax=Vanrija pseudolonga TaxID=143232 RepID=A0AAF0YC19_9TREE|nr:hypothetical protein LOC62_03G005200 [Vanrija pseudolonga]
MVTLPLELQDDIVAHLCRKDLEAAIATSGDVGIAASRRLAKLKAQYGHVIMPADAEWPSLESPEHREYTRIISVPDHDFGHCLKWSDLGQNEDPVPLDVLDAVRVHFAPVTPSHVAGQPPPNSALTIHGHNREGCWSALPRLPAPVAVLRGLSVTTAGFCSSLYCGGMPLELADKVEHLVLVFEPDSRLPVSEEDASEWYFGPREHPTELASIVQASTKRLTVVFNAPPGSPWRPTDAPVALTHEVIASAVDILLEDLVCRAIDAHDENALPLKVTIVNLAAIYDHVDYAYEDTVYAGMSNFLGDEPACICPDEESEDGGSDAKDSATEGEAESDNATCPRTRRLNELLGPVQDITMEEYLVDDDWELVFDRDEVAAWLDL